MATNAHAVIYLVLYWHLRCVFSEILSDMSSMNEKNEALSRLRLLLEGDKRLHPRTDEEFLLRFLHVRKHDVEASMKTIQKYYRNRASCPEVYSNFVPSSVDSAGRRLLMVLPAKDVHGRPVLYSKPGLWNPREVSYVTLQKSVLLCLEHIATDPASQAAGVSILCDSAGFTLDKLFSCNIGLLRRFLEYVQDCMPMRLKAVHIIRESKAMDLLFVLLRPFIKRKLAQRIHFHGASYGKLYEDLPPSMLPEEYGGETEPYDCESFWNQMDSEEAAFVKNNEFGYFGAKPKRRSSR